MSGIRVKDLPSECTEKDIKIFFSKPENHGGPIGEIYFPLFKGHAVVIFSNSETADKVILCQTHKIQGKEIRVEPIPFPQVFTTLKAKFDPAVAAFIQATEHIKDEIQYNKNIELLYDETRCLTGVRGNWYMLEWVWTFIEQTSRQQKNARRRPKPLGRNLNEPRSPSPMDTAEPIISMPSSTKTEKDKTTAEKEEDSFKNKAEDNEPKKAPPASIEGERSKIENIRSGKNKAEKEKLNDRQTIERMTDLKISEASQNVNDITILSDKADIQTLDFRYGPLTVCVYTGMITLAETDAIVNAANGSLSHYGGIADAIAKAAGNEMQRECEEYIIKFGSVPTTEVMHTIAGGKISQNVKYIMHAVGPICLVTTSEKEAAQLTQTFLNSMKYGNDVLKINSLALPAISSGVFGCPLEICIKSFINSVLLFANDHMGDSVHLREVHLVNIDGNNTALTVMQLREVISQGTQKLVSEAQQQIQRAEEEDIRYRFTSNRGQRLGQDRETDYDFKSLSAANTRQRTSLGSSSSSITSFGADFSPTGGETRGIHYTAGTPSERFGTSPALDYQRSAATGSHNTRLETEDRPYKHETDPYMTNISRNYYPLTSSESSASRFSYVPSVGGPAPDERQKRSIISPGSSKPGPSTSGYSYEENTWQRQGGTAITAKRPPALTPTSKYTKMY